MTFNYLEGFFIMDAPHVLLAHGPCMTPPGRRWSSWIWRAPNQCVATTKLPLQHSRVATGSTQGAMHLKKDGYLSPPKDEMR